MLKLWVLIILTWGGGAHSVEFRTEQQCDAARTRIEQHPRAERIGLPLMVCAEKTVGGP